MKVALPITLYDKRLNKALYLLVDILPVRQEAWGESVEHE